MMRPLLIVLFLLAACAPTVPKLKHLGQDAVVLAFGDSITDGVGAPEGENYPAILQNLIGRTVIRSGVPGEVTAKSLIRLPGVLEETNPQLMILCIGGNDFLHAQSEQQAAENIRAMIRLAKEKGVEVVLIGVPKFGLMLSPPDFYQQIAEEYQLPYEAEVMHKILLKPDLKADEVHPNAAGYRVFAESVAALLKQAKAI